MVDGVKMSKSLGNFHNVDEIISKYPAEALRLLFLTTHYHQPFNFTFAGLEQAKSVLDKFYNALLKTQDIKAKAVAANPKLIAALRDDINTPLAITVLHEIVANLNKAETDEEKAHYKGELIASAELLGLLYQEPTVWFKGNNSEDSDAKIEELINARLEAKKNKDWATADKIRNELKEQGIILEDTPNGTTWKRI